MNRYLYLAVRINKPRFLLGLGVWFAETAYFGWNATAQSPAEHWLDLFSIFLMILAFEVKRLRSCVVIVTKQENESGNEKES